MLTTRNFCCYDKTPPSPKPHGGGMGLFGLQVTSSRGIEELKQRPWRNAAYCLLYFFFSLGPQPTYLGMTPPIVGWAFLHQLAIKKISPTTTTTRPYPQASLISQREIPSSQVISVCHLEVAVATSCKPSAPQASILTQLVWFTRD